MKKRRIKKWSKFMLVLTVISMFQQQQPVYAIENERINLFPPIVKKHRQRSKKRKR
jgi:hypothetical protein